MIWWLLILIKILKNTSKRQKKGKEEIDKLRSTNQSIEKENIELQELNRQYQLEIDDLKKH